MLILFNKEYFSFIWFIFYVVFNIKIHSLTYVSFMSSTNGLTAKSLATLQEDTAWSALVKLFDPVKSPRGHAVIALKQQH